MKRYDVWKQDEHGEYRVDLVERENGKYMLFEDYMSLFNEYQHEKRFWKPLVLKLIRFIKKVDFNIDLYMELGKLCEVRTREDSFNMTIETWSFGPCYVSIAYHDLSTRKNECQIGSMIHKLIVSDELERKIERREDL